MLMANSAAILTDAFPARPAGHGAWASTRRRRSAGSFIGLVLGGVLAPINWRLIFLVSVPIGLFGTVWGYLKLRELERSGDRPDIDWPGNITFAARADLGHGRHHLRDRALRRPHHGLDEPVRARRASSAASLLLVAFGVIETSVAEPMFRLQLFKIRAFTAGIVRQLPGRVEPRRAHVHAHHLAAGDLAAPARLRLRPDARCGPASPCSRSPPGSSSPGRSRAILSDRFGARPFATGGMIGAAVCFVLLELLAGRLLLLGRSPSCCSSRGSPWRCSGRPTGPGS